MYISIHALREEGDKGVYICEACGTDISIHALREEGDAMRQIRGLTQGISIHALREEGDARAVPAMTTPANFYPRPPRGGRRSASVQRYHRSLYFYPRPPRGGRPASFTRVCASAAISIHALREEGDVIGRIVSVRVCHFYPRPPRGGRPN